MQLFKSIFFSLLYYIDANKEPTLFKLPISHIYWQNSNLSS